LIQTFFNQFNTAVPVTLDSLEVASAIHEIIQRTQPDGHPERQSSIHRLRRELSNSVAFENGHCCPVCGSLAKVYPRTLTKGMVKSMAKMVELGGRTNPVTIRDLNANGGDHAKLRFWGFVYQQHDSKTGKAVGWRVTENGMDFLHGKLSAPRTAYLFQNCLVGYSVEEIHVKQRGGSPSAFGEFSFEKLMVRQTGKIILCG
jgi:hypothetical protein